MYSISQAYELLQSGQLSRKQLSDIVSLRDSLTGQELLDFNEAWENYLYGQDEQGIAQVCSIMHQRLGSVK
ncbi:hypothetical protein [Ferrimonas aestuarii]|uniref:Uncharacterized protein n=1 Tax=Ferrimonas aestuarii TaxID=2569539 RepID=A0A4U1BML2_9GAMM|nr:hypothetical protein [Ferrimonas aestuarii]TKB54530.1 hypothetical protein FCL42_12010 [Ferrimonas aestuarii]